VSRRQSPSAARCFDVDRISTNNKQQKVYKQKTWSCRETPEVARPGFFKKPVSRSSEKKSSSSLAEAPPVDEPSKTFGSFIVTGSIMVGLGYSQPLTVISMASA
jgi:hypothetical protein